MQNLVKLLFLVSLHDSLVSRVFAGLSANAHCLQYEGEA